MASNIGNKNAQKYSKEDIEFIEKELKEYIKSSSYSFPSVSGFISYLFLERDFAIPRTSLYSLKSQTVSTLLKMLIEVKKDILQTEGAIGESINPSFAIFALKQLGWSDKQEVNQNNNNKTVVITRTGKYKKDG